LTNFIIDSGDYLILEVIPNTGITQTSWDLYFTCLENFSCDSCLETNPLFKISASTISFFVNPTCNTLIFQAKIIGCPSYANEDIFKYMHSVTNQYLPTWFQADGTTYYPNSYYQGLQGNQPSVSSSFNVNCIAGGGGYSQNCQSLGNTINVTKVGSVITITCSSLSDRDAYYNSYLTMYNLTGWSPTPPLPTSINYYRYLVFKNIVPLSSLSTCGDNQYTTKSYYIHPSSTVTTGGGPGSYTMTINLVTITNQYPVSSCNSCQAVINNIIAFIDDSITSPNVNLTTNTGLRYDIPFAFQNYVYLNNPTQPVRLLGLSLLSIPYYSTTTIPYSGTPLTVIPSLSATTCDFNWMNFVGGTNPTGTQTQYFTKNFGTYYLRQTDINNPTYFEIWTDYPPSGTPIYEVNASYPSGHIIDPNYFI
jgi:hypothetical protein